MNFLNNFTLVDLTQKVDKNTPTYTGDCGFKTKKLLDYHQGACVVEYYCLAGCGTHMDAPSHFIPNGRNIADLALDEICAPVCVIDMSEKLTKDAKITLKDFEKYEKEYGEIPKDSVVVGNTRWSQYWSDPKIYRGEGKFPHCPTFSSDVGDLLIKRDVRGVGIDTFSPDKLEDNFPLHKLLLGSNKFIIENLTNLEKLSKKGSYLIALPLKIEKGPESPIRAIGLVPK